MSIEQCLALAKDAGFEGMELCFGENAPASSRQAASTLDQEAGIGGYCTQLALDTPEEDIKAIAELSRRIGIEVYSVATALNFHYPLTSPRPQIRAKGIEVVRKSLQLASLLGANIALVIPGMVTAEVSYSQALGDSEAALSELLPQAEGAGVYLALENVWNKFLLSPLEFRDFIDKFQSEYLCALFDVANILVYGYPEQWIEILGSRIKCLHVKDFRTSIGNMDGFVNLLQGDIDWPVVIKALRKIKYDGFLTVETIPAYKHCPESQIYEAAIALDRIINL